MRLQTEEEMRARLEAACAAYGLRRFCELHGLDHGGMSNVVSGKRRVQRKQAAALGFEEVRMFRAVKGGDEK